MAFPSIDLAQVSDADALVRLFTAEFEPRLRGMTPYFCAGAPDYVRELIRAQGDGADAVFLVARTDDQIVGGAEIRLLPGSLFLNFVCVSPDYRAQGIAGHLVACALERFGSNRAHMRLDVFEHNEAPRRWYERLGFREESAREWWTMPLRHAMPCASVTLTDFAQAQACHAAYGFSRFQISTRQRTYTVGRLGDRWFRLDEGVEALGDDELQAALARLDARREMLLLLPLNPLPAKNRTGVRFLGRALRMIAKTSDVLARLRMRRADAAHLLDGPRHELTSYEVLTS